MELIRVQAEGRRRPATVVFVHHFGGHALSVRRHQEFVSGFGLDSVAFTLSMQNPWPWGQIPQLRKLQIGLRSQWRSQCKDVFNEIKGPKILFSFSFPSAPAIEVFSQLNPEDRLAWIADGGPFFHLTECMWNYFTHQEPTRLWPLRAAKAFLGLASVDFWSLETDVGHALNRLPQDFPILSIRYWQDKLVPIAAIDPVFAPHPHLHLETLSLPEAPHCGGLVHDPDVYKSRVGKFLNTFVEQ